MKKIKISVLFATLILSSLFSCTQTQKNEDENSKKINYDTQKVYEWRGYNRSGIYPDTGLLKVWPEKGPELVWEYEGVGNGYGSPVFTTEEMFIQGEIDSMAYLLAFDLEGKLKWKEHFGKEWVKNYNGSRSAPTIVNDLIYVCSGLGNVACFERESGEKKWSVDMMIDLHGEFPLFGISEALIIEDEKVFCTPGGKDTNVVALNRYTGDIIWISKGAGQRPGYSQPQIIKLKDRNILVSFTAYELLGHDTKTGELLWVHEQDNIKLEERKPGAGDTHSNTIIYEDGFIYYAAGDGNGGVKLELSPDGKSIKEVWRNKDFDSYMGGIVKIGDYLYGSGTAKAELKCINASTGKIESISKYGKGAVIAADNMLYYYNFGGQVMLISQDPKNMDLAGKFRMTKGEKEHFAHPVINNGKLFIRHGDVIQAYNIMN